MDKNHEDKDSSFPDKRHESNAPSYVTTAIVPMLTPAVLGKHHCCNRPNTEHPHENHDAQRLLIQHLYGHVHPTTALQVRNDYSLWEFDDAESTVSTAVSIAIDLYQPTTFVIERDNELSFYPKVNFRSH